MGRKRSDDPLTWFESRMDHAHNPYANNRQSQSTEDQLASAALPSGNGSVQPDGTVTISFSINDLGEQVGESPDSRILIPKTLSPVQSAKILIDLQKQLFEPTDFSASFDVRPYDGASALMECLRRKFGIVFGRATQTMFGPRPPEIREVRVGPGPRDTIQIPWGKLTIPSLQLPGSDVETVVTIGYTTTAKYGVISEVTVSCARGLKRVMDELFDEVRDYLSNNSIYRGKALRSVGDPLGIEFPELRKLDPGSICYSKEIRSLLSDQIHSFIEFSQYYRDQGIQLRRAALLHGPYGTGKSSFGWITAQIAVQHGWTFVFGTPKDSPERLLEMAQMYAPAVVFIEDIDVTTSSGSANEVTAFLEAFDGVSAKTQDIIIIMTTNSIENIHEGMMRPGRFDIIAKIGMLDPDGVRRLIEASLGERKLPNGDIQRNQLSPDIDWEVVTSAMDGFYPAYVKEATIRVRSVATAAAARHGKDIGLFTTEHLVSAAHLLREHLELQEAAGRGHVTPDIDSSLRRLVASAVELVVANTTIDGDEDLIPNKEVIASKV